MSFALRRGPRWWALPLLLLLAGAARAQPGVATVREREEGAGKYRGPPGGAVSVGALLRGLISAEANNEQHQKARDAEAKLVAYRIFSREYHKPANPDPARPADTNPQS